ncbi:alpha/beta hydrolase [Bailinhaonella thermotolerans]|uniref:Alpha/beta hydrolase n=1 Tax=Bailinhaonella thermotolerans TaxID=1070861 RepID=A0A3A4A747_9ACTN|nr:alpha/beta hydrolase [Bailinhaonella thermotolerans]RJL21733.1 alpha/beta hydrolase [Bailinhaonella thermotolerans]
MGGARRVEFGAGEVTLVGDLRGPEGAGLPGLVLTGPFTGTRDQVTGLYAERLAAAGYVTLAFDHRNWGESGGLPRGHEDPEGKLADLRAATTWLREHPSVDPDRVGVVGICLGGGYALKAAAFDPRLRVFAGIAGAYNSPYSMQAGMGPEDYRATLAGLADAEGVMPAVAREGEAAMPGDEPYSYYGSTTSPHWRDEVTRASIRELLTVDLMIGADFLSPTPALIVHGIVDRFCSPEGAEEAYKRLSEPKKIVWLDATRHVDLYDAEPYVTQAVEATVEFLREHL